MTGTNWPFTESQLRRVPGRAHAQHERLFRQRNRRCPFQAERAEIGDRGDGTAGGVRRQFAVARQLRPVRRKAQSSPSSNRLSALRMTGTSTPSSASTAKAMSIEEGCTILFPTSRPAGALFSASATASARKAQSAGPGLGRATLR